MNKLGGLIALPFLSFLFPYLLAMVGIYYSSRKKKQ
nr:MAG TPA: hypothetical protein [Caudoviricetes sp.]